MRTLRTALLCSVLFAPTLAGAAPLTVVDVAAPAINCVFNPTCTVVVTDTPGFPLHGYDYRADMTSVKGKNCVAAMRIETGPLATENYKPGTPAQLYVVTSGGLARSASPRRT